MKISDLRVSGLVGVEPATPLADVARQMRTREIDSVAVMSEGRLAGIITERDLVQAIAEGVDPRQASAEVIMTPSPATITEDEDVSVAALKMLNLGVRHLPVVDEKGQPVGLLSARDLVAVLDRARP